MSEVSMVEGEYSNPSYLVTLKTESIARDSSDYVEIQTYLPESFSFNLTSNWDSLLKSFASDTLDKITGAASGIGGTVGSLVGGAISAAGTAAKIANDVNALAGRRTIWDQFSTLPTWTGNSPIEFDIPFKFQALTDAKKDVHDKYVELLKLASPHLDNNNILKVPGPQLSITDDGSLALNQDRVLSISIGNFIYIKGIIITSVSPTIYTKFDVNGIPISADCTVSFKTVFSPTRNDIINWFSANRSYSQLNNFSVEQALKSAVESYKEAAESASKVLSKFPSLETISEKVKI